MNFNDVEYFLANNFIRLNRNGFVNFLAPDFLRHSYFGLGVHSYKINKHLFVVVGFVNCLNRYFE